MTTDAGQTIYFNVCQNVKTEMWNIKDNIRESDVGGFVRHAHGDFVLGWAPAFKILYIYLYTMQKDCKHDADSPWFETADDPLRWLILQIQSRPNHTWGNERICFGWIHLWQIRIWPWSTSFNRPTPTWWWRSSMRLGDRMEDPCLSSALVSYSYLRVALLSSLHVQPLKAALGAFSWFWPLCPSIISMQKFLSTNVS